MKSVIYLTQVAEIFSDKGKPPGATGHHKTATRDWTRDGSRLHHATHIINSPSLREYAGVFEARSK